MSALYDREPADWTDEELAAELRTDYQPSVIPPCRVCGAPLALQGSGGGQPDVWGCAIPRTADEHYRESRYLDRRRGGDARVMEALRRWGPARARPTQDPGGAP